jgi:hypothetical protein
MYQIDYYQAQYEHKKLTTQKVCRISPVIFVGYTDGGTVNSQQAVDHKEHNKAPNDPVALK